MILQETLQITQQPTDDLRQLGEHDQARDKLWINLELVTRSEAEKL